MPNIAKFFDFDAENKFFSTGMRALKAIRKLSRMRIPYRLLVKYDNFELYNFYFICIFKKITIMLCYCGNENKILLRNERLKGLYTFENK